MNDAELNDLKSAVEELVISEIELKTGLILTKVEFSLNLKSSEKEISGDVILFDEYYENFRIQIPRSLIKEKICEMVFLVFSEFGELKGTITSGKRNTLEAKLEQTTNKILNSIESNRVKLPNLGNVTIMIDEIYPYGQTYKNNFPLLQYEIRDSNKIINLSFKLNNDLNDFDEQKVIEKVEKKIKLIVKENTGHNKR